MTNKQTKKTIGLDYETWRLLYDLKYYKEFKSMKQMIKALVNNYKEVKP